MRHVLLTAGLALGFVTGVGAAPLPGFVKDTVGNWLGVTDDGKPGCRVDLKGEKTTGGWRASPAADCAARLPAVAQAAGWTYDGGVRLLGADGKVLLDFQEDETTIMKTSFETKPVFFIVKAPPQVERAPFAPALVGTWILRRPGGPAMCSLAFSTGAKDDNAKLTVKSGAPCDPAIARLKLNSARVEDVTLMLYGQPDTSLRLESSGADSYAKTEGGRPLEMVRAP